MKAELSVRHLCAKLGYSRATWHRRQRPVEPRAKTTRLRPPSPLKLTAEETLSFLQVAHSPQFVDKSPAQIYFSLLDVGCYICSIRTMYRILAAAGEVKERRNQLRRPSYKRPELLATGPNQLWSWDITKLRGPTKGSYYHLYVVIDVYSRFVVGWLLSTRESDTLAEQLLATTIAREAVQPHLLKIHADRGPSMTSGKVVDLLEKLGVARSHSRPCISNDNPYSEAQFRTLKYRPDYPERFGCIEDARCFTRRFFNWYNFEHYHSAICWLNPSTVHYGQSEQALETRHGTLTAFYNAYPGRFLNGPPRVWRLPRQVWINEPWSAKATN